MVSATEPRLYCVPAPETADGSERHSAPDGAPPGPWTKTNAYRFCERMAATHYENFPVASKFLPAHLRPHIAAIYAFARTADDFSDEPRFEGRRRQALDAWEQLLETCFHRDVQHPVFLALRDTVRRHNIPIGPLRALLTAFRMDLTKHRYATFGEVRHYCTHSANPVGQLVLYVHGHRDPALHRFSDEICTALQIANFLQDLSVDIPRGRIYIPEEDLVHFGVGHEDLLAGRAGPEFRELMEFSVARVRSMFHRGRPLIRRVSPGLSMELDATWRGGMAVLQRIEDRGFDTLSFRPTLEKRDVAGIAVRSLFSFGRRLLRGRLEDHERRLQDHPRARRGALRRVTGILRRLTERSSSNFKFAFLFLGQDRAEGLRQVYEFCRVVDDIVDEREPGPHGVAKARLQLGEWSREVARIYGDPYFEDDPPHTELGRGLSRTHRLFDYPREAFDEIIAGVAMDLDRDRYEDLEDLRLYCYRVASCVGFLCLALFGDQREAARRYGEHLGLALQYTNILRDVAEDAARGRIYLPRDLLRRHGLRDEDVLQQRYDDRFVGMASDFADAAEREYRRAWEALREADARALLPAEIMGRTYHRILGEIRARNFNVFTRRPALRRRDKLEVAALAIARSALSW